MAEFVILCDCHPWISSAISPLQLLQGVNEPNVPIVLGLMIVLDNTYAEAAI